MKKLLAIFFCIIILSGCATNHYQKGTSYTKPAQVKQDKATVYLFRPHAFVGSIREYNFSINGEVEATLPNGTYVTIHLDPGEYSFGAQIVETWHGGGPYIETTYVVAAGNEYFVGYFKDMPLSASKSDDYFINKEESQVYSGILEGGVFDADHQIGVVNKKHAIQELKKLSYAVQKPI